jgi:hypothetical protein
MNIFIMTGYANNDVCVFGWDDWDFIAILVLINETKSANCVKDERRLSRLSDILNRILDFLETCSKGKLVMRNKSVTLNKRKPRYVYKETNDTTKVRVKDIPLSNSALEFPGTSDSNIKMGLTPRSWSLSVSL